MSRGAPRRIARRVVVEARAKLNLGLAVGPRRADGYHEIATVFQSVSLADTLVAEPRRRGFSLRVRHESAAVRGSESGRYVPRGGRNLTLAAARRFAETFDVERGARFTLIKRIPSRAGLGGASADAAAVLAAMTRLYGLRVPRAHLSELAGWLGADVPFALSGGTAVGRGKGERLTALRLQRPFRAVVAVPRWRVSTRAAFARIEARKFGLTRWGAKLRFVQSLRRKRLSVSEVMRLGNDFEDVLGSYRARLHSLRARFLAAGLTDVRMTGSGSAVFGILPARASAERVIGRISGTEALYRVRSCGAGLNLLMSR